MSWTFHFDDALEIEGTIPYLVEAGWPVSDCQSALEEAFEKFIGALDDFLIVGCGFLGWELAVEA